MDFIHSFGFTTTQWLWLLLAAFVLGFSKTGVNGIFMLSVTIIASAFGSKESTGILLPWLLIGDIFAVIYYSRHVEWKNIWNLLPWVIIGLFTGVITGNQIDSDHFKYLIAFSVLICLIVMLINELKNGDINVPEKLWFYALTGIAAGFTTMVGNAGGPVLTLYLIAKGFKKNNFLGTITWLFFIVNIAKMPLQIFFWNNVTLSTVLLSPLMIPAIAAGAFTGAAVIKRMNEKPFRFLVIFATAVTTVKLLL